MKRVPVAASVLLLASHAVAAPGPVRLHTNREMLPDACASSD